MNTRVAFIRPAPIDVTPAFSRVLEALGSDATDISIFAIEWNSKPVGNRDFDRPVELMSYSGDKTLLGYLGWLWFVLRSLSVGEPTHIHNFSFRNWAPIFIFLIVCRIKQRDSSPTMLFDCRDYYAWAKRRRWVTTSIIRWVDCRMASMCHTVIFPDETGFNYFRGCKSSLCVVANTVQDYFSDSEVIRSENIKGSIKFFYAGYLSDDRNIRAILSSVEGRHNLELHIASNYIPAKFQEINPAKNIVMHGELSHRESIEIMIKCDYVLIMYDPEIQNHQLIRPTKFYDAIMSNTAFICSNGMKHLERYTGEEWPNIALDYGLKDSFDGFEKPTFSQKNRNLYLANYEYGKEIDILNSIYSKFIDG